MTRPPDTKTHYPKYPWPKAIAEGLLNEAHDHLIKAAKAGELCPHGKEARLLIGEALIIAQRSPAKGVLGQWPAEAVEKVKQAQFHLRRMKWSPDADRALYSSDAAARLLQQTQKLRYTFNNRSIDWEAALRSSGNIRAANDGRGHGVPLARPLTSPRRNPPALSDTERPRPRPASEREDASRGQATRKARRRARKDRDPGPER